MRLILVAALSVFALSMPAGPAEARSRTEQAQARPAAAQTARAAATRRAEVPQRQARAAQPATRQARASQPAGRQAAASRQATSRTAGRQQQASAACGRGSRCAPRQVSWQAGLAPATNEQAQSCPAGTLATLARGHSDVVRCVPL